MFLSKRSNGIYYLWFDDESGQRRKVSTHSNLKTEALKFLRDFKETETQKRHRVQYITLSHFAEEFMDYARNSYTKKTQSHFQVAFREFIKKVGDLRLTEITLRMIENFLAQKKTEASDWTARKYYGALASAFEKAKQWGYLSDNLFRKIPKPKAKETQPVYFTIRDFNHLLNHIEDRDFKELCITAFTTGMRLGELRSLEWSDVDFIRKVIYVRNKTCFTTKSKKNRIVPMNEQLWKMLAVRKESSVCEFLFHRDSKQLSDDYITKTFKKYVRLARLDDRLKFHSLRHSFASNLVLNGVSLFEVQKLLGHSSPTVTMIYSHLLPEQLHSTVNKLELILN